MPLTNLPRLEVFLDTSVMIAAVMSPTGGARLLLHMGEAGIIRLITGKSVIQEADEVLRRKAAHLLPLLARLMDAARIEISKLPSATNIQVAEQIIEYPPDRLVLAEAIQSNADWFVTHDREHFLNNPKMSRLPFRTGSSGDLLVWVRQSS
ncbi:MAG: putative toxin-antitoxin system toxin component, PIN family [Chloroflexi bacterium]|nr:putative toxin-antitoxin system toxin component, PIN family [Chloroflexota bacterium]